MDTATINKLVLSLWDLTLLNLSSFATKLHLIVIKAYALMSSQRCYFSKMKCGLVVIYFLKPWMHNFMTSIRCQQESAMCNRKGTDKTTQEYVYGPLKSGCTFHFKFSSLETETYMPTGSSLSNWQYKKDGTGQSR